MLEQKELSFLIKTLCCVYLFLSAERCYRHKAFNTEYKKSSDRMVLERLKHSYISSRNKRSGRGQNVICAVLFLT